MQTFFKHGVIVAHHERGYELKFVTSSPSIFNNFLKITEIGLKKEFPLFTGVRRPGDWISATGNLN